jgi:hypothetical protein
VPESEYWEKIQRRTYGGVEHLYHCYVRVRIPREQYAQAREMAIGRALSDMAGDEDREEASGGMFGAAGRG